MSGTLALSNRPKQQDRAPRRHRPGAKQRRGLHICIPAREKREAIGVLVQRRKGRRHKWAIFQLFAVALYYLIRELPSGDQVTIDVEYTGHEDDVKSTLLPLLWRDDPGFDAENITFGHVGKRSSAHKKALAVYRGQSEADKTLKADDLLRQIIGQ